MITRWIFHCLLACMAILESHRSSFVLFCYFAICFGGMDAVGFDKRLSSIEYLSYKASNKESARKPNVCIFWPWKSFTGMPLVQMLIGLVELSLKILIKLSLCKLYIVHIFCLKFESCVCSTKTIKTQIVEVNDRRSFCQKFGLFDAKRVLLAFL